MMDASTKHGLDLSIPSCHYNHESNSVDAVSDKQNAIENVIFFIITRHEISLSLESYLQQQMFGHGKVNISFNPASYGWFPDSAEKGDGGGKLSSSSKVIS